MGTFNGSKPQARRGTNGFGRSLTPASTNAMVGSLPHMPSRIANKMVLIVDLNKGLPVYHTTFKSRRAIIEKLSYLKNHSPEGDYVVVVPDRARIKESLLLGKERYEAVVYNKNGDVVRVFGTSRVSDEPRNDLEACKFYQGLRAESPKSRYRLDFLVNFQVREIR